jgi:radical SAM protein with 4Fe4S-binding SPASM domain
MPIDKLRRILKIYSLNFFRSYMSCRLGLDRTLGMPSVYIIEPTNICDQKCLICETGLKLLKRRKGMMRMAEFKLIADKILPYAEAISLYWMGEPMLNPAIYDMIAYIKQKAPSVTVSIASNGNLIDPERLILSGLDFIEFKINGVDQETHGMYRVGGNFEKAVTAVKDIMRLKKERQTPYPRVAVGMIVMQHNEPQIECWEKLCLEELKCDVIRLVKPCVRTVEQAHDLLPENKDLWLYDEVELTKGNLVSKYRPGAAVCEKVWDELSITWEGNVSPCCSFCDDEITLGNLLTDELADIWNSRRMQGLRKQMRSLDKEELPQCRLCSEVQPFTCKISAVTSKLRQTLSIKPISGKYRWRQTDKLLKLS